MCKVTQKYFKGKCNSYIEYLKLLNVTCEISNITDVFEMFRKDDRQMVYSFIVDMSFYTNLNSTTNRDQITLMMCNTLYGMPMHCLVTCACANSVNISNTSYLAF